MGLLTLCGLPILQKISLRRRESRLAARALPSAVKSIFRRPRSAAFRRHPPYSCLEYGSVDYIIFAPARRASPSVESHWRCHFFVFFPRIVSNPCKKQRLASANKFAHQELDAIVFAMPSSATGIPLLNFHFADMLTIHVIDRLTPFHIAINKIKELLWAQKKSCYC